MQTDIPQKVVVELLHRCLDKSMVPITTTISDHDERCDPTPEQIEAACVEIRAGWSDAERLSRMRGQTLARYSAKGVREAARASLQRRLQAERQERQ